VFPIVPSIGPARPVSQAEETARQLAAAQLSPGVAGHGHASACPHCRDISYRADGEILYDPSTRECKCVSQCIWPGCPAEVRSPCPASYSEGFRMPAVPLFDSATGDVDEPSEVK
jgi:hypothetical protein